MLEGKTMCELYRSYPLQSSFKKPLLGRYCDHSPHTAEEINAQR